MRDQSGRRSGPITAGELMAILAEDRAFQESSAAAEADRQAREAKWREAEEPILRDLAAVGVHVDSAWDLVNTSDPYPQALPVLVEHLERGGYPDRVLEGVARALAVKPAGAYWERLRDLFLRAEGPDETDGLAVALAGSAGSAHVEPLIELIQDSSLGETRIYFVGPILKLGGARGRKVLENLRNDPDLYKEVGAMLRKPSRSTSTGARRLNG